MADDSFCLRTNSELTIGLASVRYFGFGGVGERVAAERLAGSVSRGASGSATGQTRRDVLVAKLGLFS